MSRYIAAYDIADNLRRNRVAHTLNRFGERLQKSVFELWLDPDELIDLRRLVGPMLSEDDEFEIIPIDTDPHRSRWRWGEPNEVFDAVVVLGR